MVEPGIEPGTSWLAVSSSDEADRLFRCLVIQFMLQGVPSIVSPSTAVLCRKKSTSAEILTVR